MAESSAPKNSTCDQRHARHDQVAAPLRILPSRAACSGHDEQGAGHQEHGHEGEQDVGRATDHRAMRGGLSVLADITR